MHINYDTKFKHNPDFRVSYRFYPESEGGRKTIPYQGYRSDFWYDIPEHHNSGQIFMIWPEFEDEDGNVIKNNDVRVQTNGTASMWILMPEMRSYHKTKIKTGLKGYFMEGSRRVAECVIIEILDLHKNPTKPIEINGIIYK